MKKKGKSSEKSKKEKALPVSSSGIPSENELFSFKVAESEDHPKSQEDGEARLKSKNKMFSFRGRVFFGRMSFVQKVMFLGVLALIVLSFSMGVDILFQILPVFVICYFFYCLFNGSLCKALSKWLFGSEEAPIAPPSDYDFYN